MINGEDMIEDYIPVNAIVPLDPERQSAIAQAIAGKFLIIQFINRKEEAPFAIEQEAREIGMVRALIGKRLFAIVGDGHGLSSMNKQMWANLVWFAQDTAAILHQCKNPLKQAGATQQHIPRKLLR